MTDWIHGAAGMVLLLIAVAGLLAVAGLARWLMLRRRRRQAVAEPAEPPPLSDQERQRLDRVRRAADMDGPAPEDQRPAVDWPVNETVSVLLRRQVPVRFDAESRSWLGGLPRMPADMAWPRAGAPGEAGRPLHFMAQIACADLPPALWDGLGPREGWLLFFRGSGEPGGASGWRVLHSADAGEERQPPDDLGPVDDGLDPGSPFAGWLAPDEVPAVWRRWPVDCVALPGDAPAPDGQTALADLLYPGEAILAEDDPPARLEPFTWRPAIQGWDALGARVGAARAPDDADLRERLAAMGGPVALLEAMADAEDARHAEPLEVLTARLADPATDPAERAQLQRALAVREKGERRLASVARAIMDHADDQAFAAFLDAQAARFEAWFQGARARVAALDAHMATVDPDSRLDPADWQDMADFLKADHCRFWGLAETPDESADGGGLALVRHRVSLWDWFHPEVYRAVPQIAADYYVDPARRGLVPDAARAVLEPWWRRSAVHRPHRIGGRPDGAVADAIGPDAESGVSRRLLLLQLASDEAMGWRHGGGLCWSIGTGSLAAGRFHAASGQAAG